MRILDFLIGQAVFRAKRLEESPVMYSIGVRLATSDAAASHVCSLNAL